MKVAELIERLQRLDPNMPVVTISGPNDDISEASDIQVLKLVDRDGGYSLKPSWEDATTVDCAEIV